ncbi:MAG: HupE/UreJ family protein [Rhodobacter sp.]|nr:HupE/UreJ family protein [Rhodobacter sp.]
MSSVARLALGLVILVAAAAGSAAHEIRPAIADVTVGADEVRFDVELALESMVAGIDLQGLDNTDAAPEANRYDALRALGSDDLEAALRGRWAQLRQGFILRAGGADLSPEIAAVEIPEPGDLDLPRDSRLSLIAALPPDGSSVTVGWIAAYGPLVVRQGGGEDGYSAYLTDGQLSAELPRDAVAQEAMLTAFGRYIVIGFEHIVPKGLDHILFVLGLFFFSLKFRPLLYQVTAFTLAHTVTLALAVLGYVRLSPDIVEPLIAASIVYVAVENVFSKNITPWRTAIVFGFGLLHGLGFASVLGDIGLNPARFLTGLIGFNLGVEFGQLFVIGVAFFAVGYWFGRKPWYRSRITTPASLAIAAVGAYWFVERTLL